MQMRDQYGAKVTDQYHKTGNLNEHAQVSFRGESQEECVKCLPSAKEWRKSHETSTVKVKFRASKVAQSLPHLLYRYKKTVSAETRLVHTTSTRPLPQRGSLQNVKVDQELERSVFK